MQAETKYVWANEKDLSSILVQLEEIEGHRVLNCIQKTMKIGNVVYIVRCDREK